MKQHIFALRWDWTILNIHVGQCNRTLSGHCSGGPPSYPLGNCLDSADKRSDCTITDLLSNTTISTWFHSYRNWCAERERALYRRCVGCNGGRVYVWRYKPCKIRCTRLLEHHRRRCASSIEIVVEEAKPKFKQVLSSDAAFQRYLNAGGDFVAIHSASHTLRNSTAYVQELGASSTFRELKYFSYQLWPSAQVHVSTIIPLSKILWVWVSIRLQPFAQSRPYLIQFRPSTS